MPVQMTDATPDIAHRLVWLKAQSTQASTQATYASSMHRFVYWATEVMGLKLCEALPPHPGQGVNAVQIEMFIAWATTKYAHATIELTISALANWHKSKGLPPGEFVRTPQVTELLKTVKKVQGPAGMPTGKLGMPRPLLRLLIGYLAEQGRQDPAKQALYLRDTTWLVMGYFGMLRRSEIIGIRMKDITFITKSGAPSHVDVFIHRSKTDRVGHGATITLTATTKDDIHIYDLIARWHNLMTDLGAQPSGPLFSSWDLDQWTPSLTPLKNGQALAKRLQTYLSQLKNRYTGLRVNPQSYGMHSLRRGGVQAAWLAGVDIEKIKSHGRWRSDAVRAYMQATTDIRLMVTNQM